MIGAEGFCLGGLFVIADRGDHGAADCLGHFDRRGADPGAACLHQNCFAGLQLGIIEQHVLHGAERDGRAGGIAKTDIGRNWHDQPRRHIHQVAGKAVDMKAHDAGDIFAEIVAAGAARLADAAGQRPVSDDAIARPIRGYVRTNAGNFAGCLDADNERQRALCEGHAAPAPHIDVIQSDRFDANLDFTGRGSRRGGNIAKLDLAIGNEHQRAHRCTRLRRACAFANESSGNSAHAGSRVMTRQTF